MESPSGITLTGVDAVAGVAAAAQFNAGDSAKAATAAANNRRNCMVSPLNNRRMIVKTGRIN
jgi:hypothetical protein